MVKLLLVILFIIPSSYTPISITENTISANNVDDESCRPRCRPRPCPRPRCDRY